MLKFEAACLVCAFYKLLLLGGYEFTSDLVIYGGTLLASVLQCKQKDGEVCCSCFTRYPFGRIITVDLVGLIVAKKRRLVVLP